MQVSAEYGSFNFRMKLFLKKISVFCEATLYPFVSSKCLRANPGRVRTWRYKKNVLGRRSYRLLDFREGQDVLASERNRGLALYID